MLKRYLFVQIIVLLAVNSCLQAQSTLSNQYKVYALSTLWKETSYNFAFFDRLHGLNWDSCYQVYLTKVVETKTDWEYYRTLESFMALLHDGHTRFFPPAQLRNIYYGTTNKRFKTRLINSKVIITDVFDPDLKRNGVKEGMEIKSINGIEIHDYAKKSVEPYLAYSTQQDKDYQVFGLFLLSGNISEKVKIEALDFNGAGKTFYLQRDPWIMEDEVFKGNPFTFIVMPNHIGYLHIHNFVYTKEFEPLFDSIYAEILKTDALIIDVRDNFGGASDLTFSILKHFTNEKFPTVNWKSPMNIAAHKSWRMGNEFFEGKGFYVDPANDKTIYTKPVNVIADVTTFSGAEDFCVGFRTIKRGKIIGTKTAGSTGSPLLFNLPQGGLAIVCTKKDVFPDGTEFEGIGIEPDIQVNITANDVKNKTDVMKETAYKDLIKLLTK